jgi:glycosyltransferase involved in cell wall biosynthesis
MGPVEQRSAPIKAVIVATWYPGVDDPGRGRFVADQAEALAGSGLVDPLVASFEIAYVDNGAAARRSESITGRLRAGAAARADLVSPGGWSTSGRIGTARLPVPEPYGRGSLPAGEEADRRRVALELLADRLDTGGAHGVVHAHTAYPDGFAAAGLARRLGWPLVITEHASFVARQLRQPEHRWRYLEAVSAASRFIAVSDMLAGELRAAIPELESKLLVLPNIIPLGDFRPSGLEERTPDELIFVGNRKERKGMVILLRAFADVLERRPNATLRLIGKAPTDAEEQRWHDLARDLEIAHAVRFDGPADRVGVAAALRRASVFVHASPRETFGVVTLEALASGLPVVATQSGGISGILEDERLGALVPPQDPRMLAKAVLRTLERRDQFDPETLRAAVERFSPSTIAPQLAALYDKVIAEAPADEARAASRQAPRDVPWAGRAEPVINRLLVVANDSDRAARFLAGMPAALLHQITLVTHGATTREALPEGLGRVVQARDYITAELRHRGLFGPRGSLSERMKRLARNPIGPLRRRLVKGGLAELRWQANAIGLSKALSDALAGEASPPEVYALDALDYAVTEPLVAAGRLRPVPGGLLWLADRWNALPPAEMPSSQTTELPAAAEPATPIA